MRRTGGWTTTLLGLGAGHRRRRRAGAVRDVERAGRRDCPPCRRRDADAQPPLGEPQDHSGSAPSSRSIIQAAVRRLPAHDTAAMSMPSRRRSRSCTMPRKPRLLHRPTVPLLLMTLAACQRPQTASSAAPTRPRTLPTPPAELTLPERLTPLRSHTLAVRLTSVDKGQLTQLTDAYKQAVAAVARAQWRGSPAGTSGPPARRRCSMACRGRIDCGTAAPAGIARRPPAYSGKDQLRRLEQRPERPQAR